MGRGGNHLILSWETRCEEQGPPTIRDAVRGTREMTKDYFCRNTLRDLRKKTEGFPIPSLKALSLEPCSSPEPIQRAPRPDPFYLHPKNKPQSLPESSATPENIVQPVTSKGTIVSFNVISGENNPLKKPTIEKRKYREITNWEDGCPDCPAKPLTYAAFRTHRSRGCGQGEKVICQECGKEVAKSNTTHLKNCPNKK